MCCARRKVFRRNWNTFGRIRCGADWSLCRKTIVGCGLRRARPKARSKAAGEGTRCTQTGASTERAIEISLNGLYLCRQRPTLLRSCSAGALARVNADREEFADDVPGSLTSSHLGCVYVTDRFDLSWQTEKIKVKSSLNGKGHRDFSQWPLFMPATTYSPTFV